MAYQFVPNMYTTQELCILENAVAIRAVLLVLGFTQLICYLHSVQCTLVLYILAVVSGNMVAKLTKKADSMNEGISHNRTRSLLID